MTTDKKSDSFLYNESFTGMISEIDDAIFVFILDKDTATQQLSEPASLGITAIFNKVKDQITEALGISLITEVPDPDDGITHPHIPTSPHPHIPTSPHSYIHTSPHLLNILKIPQIIRKVDSMKLISLFLNLVLYGLDAITAGFSIGEHFS